ncbi:MAG: CsgG/HfaB family protein [bacterium]
MQKTLAKIHQPIIQTCLTILFVVCLSACAPEKPSVTQQQITQAQQNGRLEQLYDDVKKSAALKGKTASASNQQLLQQIGKLIAEQRALQISEALEKSTSPSPSLQLLTQLETKAIDIEPYSTAIYIQTKQLLASQRDRTQKIINSLKDQQSSLSNQQYNQRIKILSELAALEGSPDSQQALENAYQQRNKSLIIAAQNSIEQYQYQAAYEILLKLPESDRKAPPASTLLAIAKSGISAEQIRKALQENDTTGAYMIYVHMLESDMGIPDSYQDDLNLLGQLLASQCAEETKQAFYYKAFNHCRQALLVQPSLNTVNESIETSTKNLNEALFSASAQANAQQLPGVQLGYLYAIRQLDPAFSGLDRAIKKPYQTVNTQAVMRLSVATFKDSSQDQRFGEQIAAHVTESLFHSIPENIRIVERTDLNAIMRERKMDQELKQSLDSELDSAEYLVQGSILEANVDSVDKIGKKTMQVQTNIKTIPNPDYVKWLEKHRASDDGAPAKTIDQAVMENVTLNITQHRKIGIFSSSYRLIRTRDAKVVSTNTFKKQNEVNGESIEGLEIGQFKQPMQIADLPSDLEILNDLSTQVANQIADALIEILSKTESEYAKKALEEVENDNLAEAAEQQAKASVILENKGKDTHQAQLKLIQWALESGV